MEKKTFNLIHAAEASWWYKGRTFVIRRLLKKYFQPGGEAQLLDMGAGYGALFEALSPFGKVDAYEIEASAAVICKERGYVGVYTDETAIRERKGAYQVIGAFDVIEHVQDDLNFIRTLHSLIAPQGILVATVPAFQFLWTVHDEESHHFRRYTKKSFVKIIEDGGFEVLYKSYWNFFLFPAAILMRIFRRSGNEGLTPGGIVNSILKRTVFFESSLMPPMSWPWGTSVLVVAKKVG
jgi:SAM-dependent methyltransferase